MNNSRRQADWRFVGWCQQVTGRHLTGRSGCQPCIRGNGCSVLGGGVWRWQKRMRFVWWEYEIKTQSREGGLCVCEIQNQTEKYPHCRGTHMQSFQGPLAYLTQSLSWAIMGEMQLFSLWVFLPRHGRQHRGFLFSCNRQTFPLSINQ